MLSTLRGASLDAQEWLLSRLHEMARRMGRVEELAPHLELGLRGEDAAYFYLRRAGYIVVARRWKSGTVPGGDLDLVAWRDEVLCFVEVKTRSRRDSVAAEFAVDEDKQRMLRRMARAYLRGFLERERGAIAVRFDVVSVYFDEEQPQIELREDAFGME